MKNKKAKENPLMVNQKDIKKLKQSNLNMSGEDNEIKTFIIILIVIIVIAGIVYFVTEVVKKDKDIPTDTLTSGSVNYDKISVGTLLNRPYENYYVLVYNSDDSEAIKYSTTMSLYKAKEEAKKIYFCDLSNPLNGKYYNVNDDDKSNPKATKIEDLDFGDITLLEISDGKIVNYWEDYTIIQDKLK